MRKVDLLGELQAVDTALDQASARLARITAQWGRRDAVEATMPARDAARATLRRHQAEQRDLELELEKLRGKLKADSDKLYSGRVTSPRELSDLAMEVEQDRRQVSAAEDRLLALFDVVEAAQSSAQRAEAAYEQAENTWTREQAEMLRARGALDAEVGQLTAKRDELTPGADANSLRIYESLRRTKGGLAVARVQQRTCQGCRIGLPSGEEQRARSSPDLVMCPSCGRILWAGG